MEAEFVSAHSKRTKESFSLKTKFISCEGFSEIKSLKDNKNNKNLTTVEKLVRFVKRIPKELSRDIKAFEKKFYDITWTTLTPKKFLKGIRNFHLKNSYFESLRTPKGIATMLAPVLAAVVLVLTVCFWTCNDSPLTVNVGGEYIATIDSEKVLTQASAQMHNALSGTDTNEASTVPVMQMGLPSIAGTRTSSATDVYEKLVVFNDGIAYNVSGLYVDGVFYGATEDAEGLSNALTQILQDAKARYDETTTTTFNNDVRVETGVYSVSSLMSAQTLVESAKQNFSIRLETDLVTEYAVPYDTFYEYDGTLPDTHKEVLKPGKNGTQSVFSRLVYVDGMLVDNVVQSATIIEEPITAVVRVGTQLSYEGTGEFLWPVPYTHYITSPFGPRWGTIHKGIDISWSGIHGQDIVASDSGTVTWAGYDNSGYGYYVIIDHGNGYKTLYGHACAVYVSIGDKVRKGDTIAGVGSTGYSTGDHLHFEIIKNGVEMDPQLYVS